MAMGKHKIYISTSPRASYIIVEMHLVQIPTEPNKCANLLQANQRSEVI